MGRPGQSSSWRRPAERRAGACSPAGAGSGSPEPAGGGERTQRGRLAMEVSGRRGCLAALWCLGLLGGLARVAGTHYRYLWRGCYPCHLGQVGYPVSAGDRRPGGRREGSARGGWDDPAPCSAVPARPLFPLFKVCAGRADSAEAGGSGAGAVPECPESSDMPVPSWAACWAAAHSRVVACASRGKKNLPLPLPVGPGHWRSGGQAR